MKRLSIEILALTPLFVAAPAVYAQTAPANMPSNMGSVINSAARDAEPTFTADGNTMYFNCYDRGRVPGSDICVSHRQGGQWGTPEVVEAVSTEEYSEVEPLLSLDGRQLYIMSARPSGMGGADFWVSDLVNGEWTEPRNLGAPFNTPYMDHCIYFAGDEWQYAYWTSTRPGGFGGNDIWMSERVNGVWQPAVNLGPNVNTAETEHHSLPSPDGRSLYVSAFRADGFGGEDIYVTTRDASGTWGPLVNLGPVVNSPRDDRCPAFSPDHSLFYFDSERDGGFGNKDLWYVPYADVRDTR